MKTFEYVVADKVGIHARPAGALVKEVKKYQSKVIIQHGGKAVDASRLVELMGLGVKCGDKIVVQVEGADEDKTAELLEEFIKSNL